MRRFLSTRHWELSYSPPQPLPDRRGLKEKPPLQGGGEEGAEGEVLSASGIVARGA